MNLCLVTCITILALAAKTSASEEPVYSLSKTFSTFEIREYEESSWVSLSTPTYDNATSALFGGAISAYMNGNNEFGMKLNSSTSVVSAIHPMIGKRDEFYVADTFLPVKIAPKPVDSNVILQTLAPFSVAVARLASNSLSIQNIKTYSVYLRKEIARQGFKPVGDDSEFSIANYGINSPSQQYSEVWIPLN
jgi:hypothetical protein